MKEIPISRSTAVLFDMRSGERRERERRARRNEHESLDAFKRNLLSQ
jgi:hypothetical protein